MIAWLFGWLERCRRACRHVRTTSSSLLARKSTKPERQPASRAMKGWLSGSWLRDRIWQACVGSGCDKRREEAGKRTEAPESQGMRAVHEEVRVGFTKPLDAVVVQWVQRCSGIPSHLLYDAVNGAHGVQDDGCGGGQTTTTRTLNEVTTIKV